MRLTVSFVIILLLSILQNSSQGTPKKRLYTGPNPEGTPGTPAEPPPLKKPPSDTKTPKVDTGVSTTADQWVSATNNYRQKQNMPELMWSEGIYKQLKSFVSDLIEKPQCESQPFSGMKLQRYGQNAATVTNNLAEKLIVSTVLESWYQENRFYDAKTKNCTNDDLDVCFHFTQLMWKSTQYFACRVDTCKKGSRKVIVCWYIRPGNCNDRDYTKGPKDSPCGPYLPPPPN